LQPKNQVLAHCIYKGFKGNNLMASVFKASPFKSKYNFMKYLAIIFLWVMFSCKNGDSIMPNDYKTAGLAVSNNLQAKWQLIEYEPNEKNPYQVVLEFRNEKNEKGSWILSGKSSVNFYQADYDFSGQKIKITNLTVTEIAGNSAATIFEEKYLERLLQVSDFIVKNETLTLSSLKHKMVFKLTK
jgi:heat shock protein HslJ